MLRNAPHGWANHHAPDQRLPLAVGGKGCRVFGADGRSWLDSSGGPALFSLGHQHPEVIEALKRQLDRTAFAYAANFTSEPIDALADLLLAEAGEPFTQVHFGTSGSEANETAYKIALQYHAARGEPGRTKMIARRQSWHGYTMGALSLSGFPARRKPYVNALIPVTHVSPANAYRVPPGMTPETLADDLARELEQAILGLKPETVAAFIMEPVVGAAGGAVPAPPGYVRKVREVCTRYGVLLISDEVMCGVGRCGTFRAMAQDGVVPDIMTIAKGLGGGYVPLGATLFTREVQGAILKTYPTLANGHTYTGHTLACAAGLAVLSIIRRDGLVERCRGEGAWLMEELRQRFGAHPAIGDIRGRGFFVALELVADRATKRPFDPGLRLADRIRMDAFARGLICYPTAGTADGYAGDHVLLSPPYIATREDMTEMLDLLGQTFAAVLPGAS
jgi:adenosylmethionine-8-amino-7-oxononanoate aminotransferase